LSTTADDDGEEEEEDGHEAPAEGVAAATDTTAAAQTHDTYDTAQGDKQTAAENEQCARGESGAAMVRHD